MPRYFFNVHDRHSEIDDVGVEVSTLEALRCETVRFAGEVLTEDAATIAVGEDWHLEVVDESGLLLFRLDINLFTAAAALRPRPAEAPR